MNDRLIDLKDLRYKDDETGKTYVVKMTHTLRFVNPHGPIGWMVTLADPVLTLEEECNE